MHSFCRPLFLLLVLYLTAFPSSLQGQVAQHYTWTPLARTAYQKTIQLRFEEARTLLNQIHREDPDNLIALHIEDYLDFFTVFIQEDQEAFSRLKNQKDARLKAIQNGPEDSPWHLFIQADIRLHWALAHLKFEAYTTAFFEVNKAFKLLTRNVEAYPDFMPNLKDLGILHAAVGTIPDSYRWTVEWLSALEGSIDQGQKELEQVVAYCQNHDFIFEEETYVLYAYLMLHLNNEEDAAWQIISESRLDPKTSLMACFVQANIALRTKRNDRAIALLEQRPQSTAYHPFPYLDFMLGVARLQKLDEQAEFHFLQFLQDFRGRNFIKEAYQKLAWNALVQGREAHYHLYMQQCLSEGYTLVDSDKAAENEAREGVPPNRALLRARLLYDGGYFERAYASLQEVQPEKLTSPKDLLEYHYRRGRILQAQGKYDLALSSYQRAVEMGQKQPWYFACRAALETGHIHERRGDYAKAREAFEACLKIKPSEHRTALHQAAKAGLERIRG